MQIECILRNCKIEFIKGGVKITALFPEDGMMIYGNEIQGCVERLKNGLAIFENLRAAQQFIKEEKK